MLKLETFWFMCLIVASILVGFVISEAMIALFGLSLPTMIASMVVCGIVGWYGGQFVTYLIFGRNE